MYYKLQPMGTLAWYVPPVVHVGNTRAEGEEPEQRLRIERVKRLVLLEGERVESRANRQVGGRPREQG